MHKSKFEIFHFIDNFDINYLKKLDKRISIIYRNYEEKENLEKLKLIKNSCKKIGLKIYLSNNAKLAINLKFDGLYIPAFNKKKFYHKINKKKFSILGGAHNLKEINEKLMQDVDYIFLSPLFTTKGKKQLGINKFKILSNYTNKKLIALGGISEKNIKKLNNLKVSGFASINYIMNKYDK